MSDDATPNPRQIRVSFRKQVSDGNYGTEAAEVTLECFVHASISSQMDAPVAEDMLDEARQLVHRQLLHSPSLQVRKSLNVPKQDVQRVPAGDFADPYEGRGF